MNTHGGARDGAGRKKLPDGVKRTQMNIKVNTEEREAVKRLLNEMRGRDRLLDKAEIEKKRHFEAMQKIDNELIKTL